jgi:dUTP pyrophosphatase
MAIKTVKVKRLNPEVSIPEYKTSGAAGFDLQATEDFELLPLSIVKVPAQGEEYERLKDAYLAMAKAAIPKADLMAAVGLLGEEGIDKALLEQVPEGTFVTNNVVAHPVTVGTGLAFEIPKGYELEVRGRSGLGFKHDVHVFNGTVDSDYRGEVKVRLYNLGNTPIKFNKGDRIAQAVIKKVEVVKFAEAEGLSETDRGENGFGSTGV